MPQTRTTTQDIRDGEIIEADLNINTPVDGDLLVADSAEAGGWEWQTLAEAGVAPNDPTYLTVDDEATPLANSRILQAGVGISFFDGGAGDFLTMSMDIDGLTEVAAAKDDEVVFADVSNADVHRKTTVDDINNVDVMFVNIADATTITSTAETDFDQTFTIPADTLEVGDLIVVNIMGEYDGDGASDTTKLRLRLGSTLLLATINMGMPDQAGARAWAAEFRVHIRSIGATGSAETALGFSYFNTSLKANTGTTTATIDTTVSNLLKVTNDFTSTGDTITANNISMIRYRGG